MAWGVLLLALLIGSTDPASARTRSYAIMDFRTGAVLRAVNPDTRLHPASLTKMMTLYLVFEAARAGRISLDKKVKISARAAATPPTRLGLRAGQRILVRHLVAAAAVRSANDAAVALAELVAGSEAEFVRRMTRKARELGMRNTTFRNATGFTAKGHRSTARDMARLGRRLLRDFPEHAETFARHNIRWGGRYRLATNTRFLNHYRGADGIKTGYTRAAGYTLVATATLKGERVIVSYFGASSSSRRTRRVTQLMDDGFTLLRQQRVALARAETPAPAPRTKVPEPSQAAVPPSQEPVAQTVAQVTATAPKAAPASPGTAAGGINAPGWAVQLGAYRSERRARKRLDDVAATHPQLFAGTEPWTPRTRRLYLAQFRSFDRSNAQALCQRLTRESIDCLALPISGATPVSPGPELRNAVLKTRTGNWAVQVGAYRRATQARARLDGLRLEDIPWLKDRNIRVPKSGRHYLAWFTGFDRASARLACQELKDRRIDCLAVATPEVAKREARIAAAVGAAPAIARPVVAGEKHWSLQVGSFRRAANARRELQRLKNAKIPELAGHDSEVRRRGRNHLVRYTGFDADAAAHACNSVRLKGFECLPLRASGASGGIARAPRGNDWAIQVGAYGKASQAVAQLHRVGRNDISELADARHWVPKQGRYFLARFRNLDEALASAACNNLRQRGVECLALAPTRN